MTDLDPQLEACCRAMCIAQGDDPDAEGRGMGHSMPLGSVYKLWEQRIPAARAVIGEWLKAQPSMAMSRLGAEYAASCGYGHEVSDAVNVYQIMCAQARKEIASG